MEIKRVYIGHYTGKNIKSSISYSVDDNKFKDIV